jgi:hypothetical protein
MNVRRSECGVILPIGSLSASLCASFARVTGYRQEAPADVRGAIPAALAGRENEVVGLGMAGAGPVLAE